MFVLEWLQNNERFMRCFTSETQVDETIPIEDEDVKEEQKKAIDADPKDY